MWGDLEGKIVPAVGRIFNVKFADDSSFNNSPNQLLKISKNQQLKVVGKLRIFYHF